MEHKIQLVKTNFNKIKDIRYNVAFCFNALETKLTKLKATTNEFIKNNRNNIFVFGLDSFQFQSKLIDYEYNDMKNFYLALNNRMYCEYYKLYKIILKYTEDIIGTNKNIEMLKSNNNIFPIYKDLEPLKQYNFDTIEEIHKTIISLLNSLNEHILFKETQLHLFQKKQKSGLNINNFVNTFDFDVVVIKQKCLLFLSYLDFFHTIHTKHFKRFSKKMKIMNDYLDEDIKFDEELQHKEDDSLKSSVSTSSLETNEDVDVDVDVTDKSLFKSNVKKVITSLKLPNNNNNNNNYLSPIKNQDINHMLASLSRSFDLDINDNKLDTETGHKLVNDLTVIDTIKPSSNGFKFGSIYENNDTINADKLVKDLTVNETINPVSDGLKSVLCIENNDIINADKLVKDLTVIETINPTLNLTQMVDIFNSQDEDAEMSDDLDKGGSNTTISNNKKKKKKKKKN